MAFLLVLQAYGGIVAVGSIANIAAAIAFRLVFARRAPGLSSRAVACLLAGVLGGTIAVAESLAAVEVLGYWKEAAGFALLFLPLFLTPTAVAGLTWVLDNSPSGHVRRSGWALFGAVAGAAGTAPALFFALDQLPELSRALWGDRKFEISRFAYWSLLAQPVALAATLGSAVAARVAGTAMARVGKSPPIVSGQG
jgi:hypothetical protein